MIPTPQRFVLTYNPVKNSKAKNSTKTYEISYPIDLNDNVITAYSFTSHGIRSFKKDRIISMRKIGETVL